MKSKYLIYFCYKIDSVFNSQVLELLNKLNDTEAFKEIFLFLGIRNDSEKQKFLNEKLNKIRIVFFKSYPNYPIFNFFIRKELAKVLDGYNINGESIFHTRGELLSWHLSKILDSKYWHKILPDIRGTRVEEIKEFSNFSSIQKFLKIWNHKKALKFLKQFDKVSTVSEALSKYLINNYKTDSRNIVITPSLAGINCKFDLRQRIQIRKELNLNEKDIVIVFSSGGTALWQNNDVLKILANKGIQMLNLSKKEISHKNVINRFVEYDKVPAYLNAADIAIIWRDKSIVNEVASPVKFSEYICCGLPVIANNSVTMIADYIKNTSFGYLCETLDQLNTEQINKLMALNREEISAGGQKLVGINQIVDSYLNTYSSFS